MNDNDVQYDVIVVGGGSAGLSAALMLSRSRWRVLVLDDGTPRNAPAEGVHNWLTRDGLPPAEIARIGRAEVTGYGGVVRDARVTGAVTVPGGFAVTTADGDRATARKLLVTTGLSDELPPVDGLAGRWGAEVFACPFCHAWEHRDTRIGVLSTGPHDLLKAHVATRWSDDVTLFLHTGPEPDDEQWAGYAACGITVVDGEVAGTELRDGVLAGLRLASGTVVGVDALAISPRGVARSGFLAALGLTAVEHPSGLGEHVPAGPTGQSDVPGLYLAGNVTDPTATVPTAVAAGGTAAAGITRELLTEDIERARRRAADPFSAESEAGCARRTAGERAHGMVP